MLKWHAAINESIHKHAFYVCLSIPVTEPFATPKKNLNTKEKLKLKGSEHSQTTAVSDLLVRAFSGKVGDISLN